MNAHPSFATDKLRQAEPVSALKAWRRRQMVDDAKLGGRRLMRLTDVPVEYGISTSTWHAWEQAPGSPDFRCPGPANMQRIREITKGEVTPADFYPSVESQAEG